MSLRGGGIVGSPLHPTDRGEEMYMKNKGRICLAEDCDRAAKSKGYCDKHYARFRKYGDASIVLITDMRKPVFCAFCGVQFAESTIEANGRKYCEIGRCAQDRPREGFILGDCEWCFMPFRKKTFTESGIGSHRFCSRQCQQKSKSPQIRVVCFCIFCKIEMITPLNQIKTYCSDSCERGHRRVQKACKKSCATCGEKFETSTTSTKMYCTPSCYPSEPVNDSSYRPPKGLASIYYLHERNSRNIRYIGYSSAQSKTWGAILSDKRSAARPNKDLVSWMSSTDVVLTPVVFVPKEQARDTHRLAVRAVQEAGWDILNSEQFLTTPEESEANRRQSGRIHRNRREMRKRQAFVEDVDKQVLYLRSNKACAYCWCALPPEVSEWHQDHIVALANGGKHCYSNLVASCPECNVAKGCLNIAEFLESIGKTIL